MLSGLVKWRWLITGLLMLGLIVLAPYAKKALVADNSLTVWFLETDPQLENYYLFQKLFGNDEVILLEVHRQQGLFNAETLQQLQELTFKLEKIDGVSSVLSLFTAQDVFDSGEGLSFDRVFPKKLPSDPDELATIRDRLTSSNIFRDRLIDAEGTKTMVWIQMAVMGDIDARRDGIIAEVRATSDHVLGQSKYYLGGLGVQYSALNIATQDDMGLFVGMSYLLMFGALWWIFRSLRLVLASLAIIAISSTIALGVYGAMGHQINMVTSIIPSLIIILGLADAIHFPSAFIGIVDEAPTASRPTHVRRTVKRVFLPCLFTTVTTVIGFASLVTSPMAVLRDMGIYTAIGLAVAFLASLALMCIALLNLPPGISLPKRKTVEYLLDGSLRLVSRRPQLCATAAIVVVVLSLIGALQVTSDTYSLGYLPTDHPVVKDHERIVQSWGDYNSLDFIVRPAQGKRMDDPDIINGLESFVREAKKIPEIRTGFSLADVYRRMADVLEVEKNRNEKWNNDEIAQLTEFLSYNDFTWDKNSPEFSLNLLAPFTEKSRATGRLFLIGKTMSAKRLSDALDKIAVLTMNTSDNGFSIEPAGYVPLYVKIIDYVTRSQINSFFFAIIVIFVLMLAWLRSFRLAIISLPSNLFPVLFMFGVMGFADIRLDIATATIAPIVLGVSIDDTIHFLHHWRDAERSGKTWEDSVRHTYNWAGRPAVTTAVLLMIGFPVLMFGQVKTIFYFGLLTTLAIGSGMIAELLILPLLLKWWPATKKNKAS